MTQLSITPAGVSLRALISGEVHGADVPDVWATSCTNDWRQVRPGDVFVAVADADHDGHDTADEAARRGAAAVICERRLPVFDVPQIVVSDSRSVYGRLCQRLVGNPSQQVKVIGVTGTHGKTTVARLLTSIFHAAGGVVGTLDSFGYWDGVDDQPPAGELTPPRLARSLAQAAAIGASHAIVEVSSVELSQRALAGVALDAVCLTHVGRRRLDWHGSLQNYRQAKRRIFDYLKPEGVAILNADDPASVEFLCELNHPALTFGLQLPAEITAQIVDQQINEQMFVLSAGDDSAGIRTAIIGDHHVYNCLAAAAMALAYGVELSAIARGLEMVDHLPGRMERLACGQDYAVLIDAAQSPDALRACLRAARQASSGRVICVFGTSEESDGSEPAIHGRVIGAMADLAAVSCTRIRSGFASPQKVHVVPERTEAIAWAFDQALPGDVVVLAGMGDRSHSPLDAAGPLANDRQIAQHMIDHRLNHTSRQNFAA